MVEVVDEVVRFCSELIRIDTTNRGGGDGRERPAAEYVAEQLAGAGLDPVLLESSASLGASRLYAFRRITLPLIRPGILAGGFITFMSSFDNVPVSLFLRDAATDMLPIRMWQDLEGKLDVTIAALSGVLIIATVVLMAIMERVTGLSKRLTS